MGVDNGRDIAAIRPYNLKKKEKPGIQDDFSNFVMDQALDL